MTAWSDFFSGLYEVREECWEWTGHLNNKGYGATTRSGVSILAHRKSWELANGTAIPGEMQVDHYTCFNHACIRPGHLRLKTRAGNQQNRQGANDNNLTSGYRNVYPNVNQTSWFVRVVHNGVKHVRIGFLTADEANEAAIALREELRSK